MCIQKRGGGDDVITAGSRHPSATRAYSTRHWVMMGIDGYSAFAWNAFIDGPGLGGEQAKSDNMCIGSCSQLFGEPGQCLKLEGIAIRRRLASLQYLAARPKKEHDNVNKEGEGVIFCCNWISL